MPRGEKSGSIETQAKRRVAFQRRKENRAARAVARLLAREVPDPIRAQACMRWLDERRINLTAPTMTTRQRVSWVRAAKAAHPNVTIPHEARHV